MESLQRVYEESSWSLQYFRQSLWTPCGVYGDYWELVGNASTGFHGVLMESLWSPHGVHVDSLWTPQSLHGLHGNPWGSVKCSLMLSGSAVAMEHIFSWGHNTISLRKASLKPEIIWILMMVKQRLCLAHNAAKRALGDS